MAPPLWRVRVWDLSNRPLGNVAFDDIDITQRHMAADTVTVTADATDRRHTSGLLDAGRRLITVSRDGLLIAGGILWEASADATKVRLTIEGLWSVLERRLVTGSSSMTYDEGVLRAKWSAVDQLRIVQDLVAHTQGKAGGDLELEVVLASGLSGVTRTLEFDRSGGTTIASAIDDLAERNNGFEWREVWYFDNDAPARQLRIGTHVGTVLTDWRWEWPRSITEFTHGTGARGDMATSVLVLGERRRATSTSLGGYPLLEHVERRPRLRRQAELNDVAAGLVDRLDEPVEALSLTIDPAKINPASYRPGDEVKVIINNGGFTNIAGWRRITDRNIKVTRSGESCRVDMGPAELV